MKHSHLKKAGSAVDKKVITCFFMEHVYRVKSLVLLFLLLPAIRCIEET
jgi:hypothetical protein